MAHTKKMKAVLEELYYDHTKTRSRQVLQDEGWEMTLKEWRTDLNLTQKAASIKLGLSFRTYCRWEAEGIPEGLETVVLMALKS